MTNRLLWLLEDLALQLGILFVEVSLWAHDRRLARLEGRQLPEDPEDPDVTIH